MFVFSVLDLSLFLCCANLAQAMLAQVETVAGGPPASPRRHSGESVAIRSVRGMGARVVARGRHNVSVAMSLEKLGRQFVATCLAALNVTGTRIEAQKWIQRTHDL